MSESEYEADGHRRAHTAVRRLREQLTALGLPEDQVRQIVPVSDMQRRTHVRIGTLTTASAEMLVAALDAAMAAAAPEPTP